MIYRFILKRVFSKGFVRRRHFYSLLAMTPILYYGVAYEWD
jgi:hypothetical protein